MKIDYDQASDILSMLFSSTPVEESDEVKPGVILDYDAAGNVSASKFWMPAGAWKIRRPSNSRSKRPSKLKVVDNG